ncbi:MAG: 1-acyl-sn-glycerol-3-phosphate acyltransferase [Bacteroidales bacterium]|nr:1-acyl-sn-glycerol-3-phosphate acyltransferase [Bacteroidales bacterium]
MEDPFLSIRHYNERESRFAWSYLIENEDFRKALRMIEHKVSLSDLEKEFDHFESIHDFQISVAKRFLEVFVENTISKMTYSGLENLQEGKSYLFLANHRDIVMDTALMQYYFFVNDKHASKIAFGNNLISSPILDVFAKLNRMFIVKRDGTIREKLANSKILSEYIKYSLFTDKESVWIAQRNGRTKDGIDKTQQGLLKMLAESYSEDVITALKSMNLTPVTISYEMEPCDQMKARELALSEEAPYQKQPGEDFESIKQGIFSYKGDVTLVIGNPIVDELDTIDPSLKNNDKLTAVCKMVDKQIYKNYQLFPNNYIAFDIQEGGSHFADKYTPEKRAEFELYLKKQCIVPDVSAAKMREYMLKIYANPVKSVYGLPYDDILV